MMKKLMVVIVVLCALSYLGCVNETMGLYRGARKLASDPEPVSYNCACGSTSGQVTYCLDKSNAYECEQYCESNNQPRSKFDSYGACNRME